MTLQASGKEGNSLPKTVMAFGEILWDILPDGPVPGGAPFNFAYRMTELGDAVRMVSRLGVDDFGERARRKLIDAGIGDSLVQRDGTAPTGTVNVTLDVTGSPEFTIAPGVAYDNIELTAELAEAASTADCCYYGTLAQRSPVSRATLRALFESLPADAVRVLDINLRKDCYTEETVRASLEQADILKLNETEIAEIDRMFPPGTSGVREFVGRAIARWGLDCCIVTLGGAGTYAANSNGVSQYVPGYRVNIADTVGSGDGFTAGFLHSHLHGGTLTESCTAGNALGALAATKQGATGSISPHELAAFIATTPNGTVHPEFS